MDMRFGNSNTKNLYRAGSLVSVSNALLKYELNLVGMQEVRWEGGGTEPAGKFAFLYGKGNENHELGTGFLFRKKIVSTVKKFEFVSDRMSYIILRGHLCHLIIQNIHAPTEDKIGVAKDGTCVQ
jgi:hypothetical protein